MQQFTEALFGPGDLSGTLLTLGMVFLLMYATALIMRPFAVDSSSAKWPAFVICAVLIFAAGVWLPREAKLLRAIVVIFGGLITLRIYSYCMSAKHRGVWDYLRFVSIGMLNPHLVYS
jgi:hypothetical protein